MHQCFGNVNIIILFFKNALQDGLPVRMAATLYFLNHNGQQLHYAGKYYLLSYKLYKLQDAFFLHLTHPNHYIINIMPTDFIMYQNDFFILVTML